MTTAPFVVVCKPLVRCFPGCLTRGFPHALTVFSVKRVPVVCLVYRS